MRLTALALAALALCLVSSVRADDPALSYVFSGKAMQGDRPVARGTNIEARVAGAVIGATTVADDAGNWSIEVDAQLFRSGICEAVFCIDGQLAGSQQINCLVELLLEAGGGQPASQLAPDAQRHSSQGYDRSADEEHAQPPSAGEPAEGDEADRAMSQDASPDAQHAAALVAETPDEDDSTLDAAGEPAGAADAREEDEPVSAQALTAPGAPETGSGGLADSPPWTAWLVAACPLVAVLVLLSRRLWSGG